MAERQETSEKRSQGVVVPKVSGFPIDLWKEWDVDCKANFGDCRWMKIWHDHLRAREFKEYQFIQNKLKELEAKINALEKKESGDKEESKAVTFTGSIKE